MITAVIVMAVVTGIVMGYAARQREELREALGKIEDLKDLAERQRVEISEAHDKNALLERENIALREMTRSHEANLEMLLGEMEKQA